MKFVWHGDHDGEKVAIDPGILDLHGRPLVNASFVPVGSERAAFVIEAGKPFVIDHKNFEDGLNVVCDWLCSHPKVRVLDRDLRPKQRGG